MTLLKRSSKIAEAEALVIYAGKKSSLDGFGLTHEQQKAAADALRHDRKMFFSGHPGKLKIVMLKDEKPELYKQHEAARRAGAQLLQFLNETKSSDVCIADADGEDDILLALTEGLLLANYQFLNYKVNAKKKEKDSLQNVSLMSSSLKEKDLEKLEIIIRATCIARDLVNEPVSTLNAVELAKQFQKLGKDAGFKVEVLNKSKIQSLKMGGLLAVNSGSDIPPTFTIMEYKPAKAKNKKPVVLVGKGVVYDTGGYNLKPGPSMETMKCDMAGAAAVGAAMWAIAKAKLPVHVIALVPATDNRINGSGYVAGDILKMYNGLTVEVLNTDAEGRLILADALSYGERFKPELVMEFSTLTGAAMAAIGHYGIVCMGTADEQVKNKLKESGNNVYERLAEFPFWDEYDELIKSDIAEIKNIGGPYGGAITAGKFLARFVSSPYIHFDIAGPAFLSAKDSYRGKGGTGVGVRLMFDFFSNY
ncbi:MAG: leucyl aminopeptidase [Bacteroidia bacterium]